MASQGPQGFKGTRGIQGAPGWGEQGGLLGPTGPTGPMGLPNVLTTLTTTVTITMASVSTLYTLSSATLTLTNGGSMTAGAFWTFANSTTSSCIVTLSGMTINGSSNTYDVLSGGSVTLVFDTGSNFIAV